MDEQTQAKFIDWLKTKLQLQTDEEVNGALQELGEEGIQQAFQSFQKENESALPVSTQMAKHGTKLQFIKSLKQYK